MYSKKAKITQAVFEALMPICFTVVSSFNFDINVVYLFALFILFYCVPFFCTSYKLRRGADVSVKSCIVHDLLCVFLPFFISSIHTDVIVSVCSGGQSWTGMASLIFVIASVIITLIFWLKYLLDKKFNNRP